MSGRSWADIVAERSEAPLREYGAGAEPRPRRLCWFYSATRGSCDHGPDCAFLHSADHRVSQRDQFHELRRQRRARDCADERALWAWALGECYPYKPHEPQRSLFPLPVGCTLPCDSYANSGTCARGDACPWPHFTSPAPLEWRAKSRHAPLELVPEQRPQTPLL